MHDPGRPRLRRLHARALIALAHPLRIEIRDHLRRAGPATATQLANRLGESSGSTSYHLRMLARHGFIEPDPGRGKGRERWWRVTPGWIQVDDADGIDDVEKDEVVGAIDDAVGADSATRDAIRTIATETHRLAAARLRTWLDGSARWSAEWRSGSTDSTYVAELDAARMRALRDELTAVIARYVASPPNEDGHVVEIQLNVFPLGEPV